MSTIGWETLNEIKEKIEGIFTTEMEVNDFTGDTVPSIDDLPDKNKGLIITNCSILFVDIRSSTQLSDRSQAKSMAKIYRAFARAMSICIYSSGGSVRQIAGDRVMGVFVDDAEQGSVTKALNAARAIITVVEHVFNPLCKTNINNKTIECGVGIDTGRVLTTSIGIKHEEDDARDLVWAGKTANVASKLTDFALVREIFITNRVFDKIPATLKTDIWEKRFRIKGDSIYEGYGTIDYYLDCIEERETTGKQTDDILNPNNERKQNEQVVTTIIEDVRQKTLSLLKQFESVIQRENRVREQEQQVTDKIATLEKKEQELLEKESKISSATEYARNKAIYEVKVLFFKENIDSFTMETALQLMNEVETLGGKMGLSTAHCHNDLYYWKLVRFFNDKEPLIAFTLIIEQLKNQLPYLVFPDKNKIVTVVKKLGKERDYLEAVLYCIKYYNINQEKRLELWEILKSLGLDNAIIGNPFILLK
ncbi:adenylate/guanylate cyclase domain-containing protein [Sporosarcina limicola]|uniref:Class 3 adenylate cyclase n=1 Tax=Sporosarcina limicola TaxID=34101 RepID=A0A927MHM2_9BACL|nr:adenylate/guanylate cyclase domain-containing protein [Sporosarcina limicola]MBE1554854.1 class 3 adenylate cyclase [Sporosarcina limicola]